jgi:hypothetical protein
MPEGIVAFLDASPVPLRVEVFLFDAGNWPWQTPTLPVFEAAVSTRDGYVLAPEGDATRLRWLGDDSVDIDPRSRISTDLSLTLDDEGRRRAIVRALRELDARRAALEVKHIVMCVDAGESGASGLASLA